MTDVKIAASPPRRRRYVPAVGPRLEKLLFAVFGLFALLAINAVYLVGVTIMEWATGHTSRRRGDRRLRPAPRRRLREGPAGSGGQGG